MKIKKNGKGFTLVEIIVVLVVIGILLAIAVPAVMGYVQKANDIKFTNEAYGIFTELQGEFTEEIAKSGTINKEQDIPAKIYKKLAKTYKLADGEIANGPKVDDYYLIDIVTFYYNKNGYINTEKLDLTKNNHSITKMGAIFSTADYEKKFVIFLSNNEARVFDYSNDGDRDLLNNESSKWYCPWANTIPIKKNN